MNDQAFKESDSPGPVAFETGRLVLAHPDVRRDRFDHTATEPLDRGQRLAFDQAGIRKSLEDGVDADTDRRSHPLDGIEQ
jgi:hypothetical protein